MTANLFYVQMEFLFFILFDVLIHSLASSLRAFSI